MPAVLHRHLQYKELLWTDYLSDIRLCGAFVKTPCDRGPHDGRRLQCDGPPGSSPPTERLTKEDFA